ncbi:type II toxin-antitoxin system Phd/YefM family antitoxin [Spiribacter onubensis]|uniref:Antitoxin n=1 Tax=Spiribacter onubensis TaxID=3122420 RepID=A0ABV3SB81_9GAMM
MTSEIGSYEAKTKLPALLRAVQDGHRYTITSRGVPVAALVPIEVDDEVARREAVAAMRALPQVVGIPDAELQDWINEGRR